MSSINPHVLLLNPGERGQRGARGLPQRHAGRIVFIRTGYEATAAPFDVRNRSGHAAKRARPMHMAPGELYVVKADERLFAVSAVHAPLAFTSATAAACCASAWSQVEQRCGPATISIPLKTTVSKSFGGAAPAAVIEADEDC
jgi:hypothetical protein